MSYFIGTAPGEARDRTSAIRTMRNGTALLIGDYTQILAPERTVRP